MPACFSTSKSISSTPTAASSYRRTCAVSALVSETKPRLGRRRCIGIWPPSKPTLWKPPARDFWPLWPRPQVLPRPLPIPRPIRLAACLEPAAGLMELSRISTLTLDEVGHLVDHAAHLGSVGELNRMVQSAQSQTAHGSAVGLLGADHALHERHLDFLVGHRLPQDLFDGLAALGRNF